MSASDHLQGIDIATVLRQKGPVVSCVVLRATSTRVDEDKDQKPVAAAKNNNNDHLVEEIQVDTTPKKNSVEVILGGPFTFVGQYEEEGIMLMAKKGCVHHAEEEKEEEETTTFPEALNPHKLQPPFDTSMIYGDILLLKVAECEDPLDDKDKDNSNDPDAMEKAKPVVKMAANDDFFLNYTKEEYLKFAARTDVVPPVLPAQDEEEEEQGRLQQQDDDEEGEDDEWSEGEDDDEEEIPEEEAQAAMMNLLMTSVLRKFQEENGRGPSTEELLVLKMTIAQKLGMSMEAPEGGEDDDEQSEQTSKECEEADKESSSKEPAKKRGVDDAAAQPASEADEPSQKKVKFGIEESQTNEKVAKAVLAH